MEDDPIELQFAKHLLRKIRLGEFGTQLLRKCPSPVTADEGWKIATTHLDEALQEMQRLPGTKAAALKVALATELAVTALAYIDLIKELEQF